MLKGVNKQVVEVVEVDNEFFERAILFVKQENSRTGMKQRNTMNERIINFFFLIGY